jgi:Bacterial SH3 domain
MRELYVVTASDLNFRSSPDKTSDNIISVLSKGQPVNKLAIDSSPWWKVSVVVSGVIQEGFVSKDYLDTPPNRIEAIGWFKEQFGNQIEAAIIGTPFDLDMLTAIAMQETYYIWGKLYKSLPPSDILEICVGDTIDSPNRSAFPKNKSALVMVSKGDQMFSIARKALEDVGNYIPSLKKVADSSPNKFCHGYGIFQLDLQFFKNDPDYFLQKKWYIFDECLNKCIEELKASLKRAYGSSKSDLTDVEKTYVAIAYNKGSVDFSLGLKQGYKDNSGKYYGEYIWEYLQLSKSVP